MFALKNLTKSKLPRAPWPEAAAAILGQNYELSLVFAPPKLTRDLNKKYRHKDYVPNVLSFPLSRKNGEIFITPSAAQKAELFFLFIHGLFHLKGLRHGSTMERKERQYLKRFSNLNEKNHYRS